ncbi:MAG TPA: hypothetical protein VK796_12615 [Cytophaga sp.]|nr:hypothetical protein [Cytophaga sp.]
MPNYIKYYQAKLDRGLKLLEHFKVVHKRLPLKKEFYPLQHGLNFIDTSASQYLCYDSIDIENPETYFCQYLRNKKDFDSFASIKKINTEGIDFCKQYGIGVWDGDDWYFYISWNTDFVAEQCWIEFGRVSFFVMVIGIIPILLVRRNQAPKNIKST